MEVQVLLVGGLVWFASGLNAFWFKGCFLFSKNSVVKFRKFLMLNGMVYSGWTDPTQVVACVLIVLVSRIQKSGSGDNSFVKWKGTFRSDRLKWPDRSKSTTFKAGPEYSGQTKLKWYVPFDVPNEISRILGWMETAQEVLDKGENTSIHLIFIYIMFKRWIAPSTGLKLYPVDNAIGFPNTYSLDSDLSSG